MDLYVLIYFSAFACSTGYLLGLGFMFLADVYNPKGRAIDPSHIWIHAKSRQKVSDATMRDVYIKKHGKRGWELRVERGKQGIIYFGMVVSVGVLVLARGIRIHSLSHSDDIDLYLLILGAILNLVTYIFISRFDWDVLAPMLDFSESHKYETNLYSSFLWFLFPFYIAVLALLIQLYIWLRGFRLAFIRGVSLLVFVAFFLGLAILVYRMINPRELVLKEEYRKPAPLSDEAKIQLIIDFLRTLREASDPIKLKFAALGLKELTGKDFGTDADLWEEWFKKK